MNIHLPSLHMPRLTQRQYERLVLAGLIAAFAAIVGLAIAGMIYGEASGPAAPALWGPHYPPAI